MINDPRVALPPSRELALAYRTQATLRMFSQDTAQAIAWGEKAIALAAPRQTRCGVMVWCPSGTRLTLPAMEVSLSKNLCSRMALT